MSTYNTAVNSTDKAIKIFHSLGVDDQLAWLWYAYQKMGGSITPAAPGAASPNIAEGLYNQVKQQSQHEQLETMRAIARRDSDNVISREYGSLGSDTKLAFWYALALGMDEGSIIGMPEDYELKDGQGRDLLAAAETMDFESQITLLRNAVEPMGAEPKQGAAV
jgi:hypothetical protein